MAIVNPFSFVCHVRADYYPASEKLRRHELTHGIQIQRMGLCTFCVKYVWYSIKHGYYMNPLEVEARASETL